MRRRHPCHVTRRRPPCLVTRRRPPCLVIRCCTTPSKEELEAESHLPHTKSFSTSRSLSPELYNHRKVATG